MFENYEYRTEERRLKGDKIFWREKARKKYRQTYMKTGKQADRKIIKQTERS